ncbi:MAG TPA: MBL fold metallo-hydrolase [Vicinamibacterales bacterium]|nr:MBL fold metallo-hydrolase [Vicinamibacterales bacterium]
MRTSEENVAFDRREFLTTSSLALAGLTVARLPLAAQQGQKPAPPTTFTDIRRNVGFFTGQGGTIGWLANPEGAVAVDAQFPATAKACVEGLQQKSAKGIQLLINTHYHGDHTAGNSVFRPAVQQIVQQERCAKLHREATTKNAEQQAYADITFGESWSQELGDEKVWGYYHGPGHTGGDAVIVFERANVVHMGDLMFNRLHPRVDGPGGASMKNWLSILEQVAKRHGDATFIFGHARAGAPVTGPAKELLYLRDYLSAALQFVQKGIAAKQPKEEIAKATELPGFTEHASSGSVLTLAGVLNSAYDELTR